MMLQYTMTAVTNRQVIVSDDEEGPVVNLAAWVGMTIMILTVFTRIGSKWSVLKKWGLDDTIILTTMLFAVGHTVTISLMVSNGLGQPQYELDIKTIESFELDGYISQLLYIPALCLAKLSTLAYLRVLSPDTPFAVLNRTLEVFVILWGTSAEFAVAFQCNIPTPWAVISGKCINMLAFWNIIGSLDILADIATIALPVYLVWDIRMPSSQKALVFVIFGTRILIIPVTILRLYFLNTVSSPLLTDQTLVSYHAYLITTIQLNLAIFVACFPFLKPFMENLSSGGFASTVDPMDSSFSRARKSKLSKLISSHSSHSRKAEKRGSVRMNSISSMPQIHSTQPIASQKWGTSLIDDFQFGLRSLTTDSNNQGEPGPQLRPDRVATYSHIYHPAPEEKSARSSIGSDRMIIKKRTEWDVREDYETPAPFPIPPSPTKRRRLGSRAEGMEKSWSNN